MLSYCVSTGNKKGGKGKETLRKRVFTESFLPRSPTTLRLKVSLYRALGLPATLAPVPSAGQRGEVASVPVHVRTRQTNSQVSGFSKCFN